MRTLRWLQSRNEPTLYKRLLLPRYAHLDALIGRSAARDVYPKLTEHLNQFNN
jgi:cholesterol oxidase